MMGYIFGVTGYIYCVMLGYIVCVIGGVKLGYIHGVMGLYMV
jgi:hypothetical protein